MINRYVILIIVAFLCLTTKAQEKILRSSEGNWEATIHSSGVISSLKMKYNKGMVAVPWRSIKDVNKGPAFNEVYMRKKGGDFNFEGKKGDLTYGLNYSEKDGLFTILATIKNNSGQTKMIDDKTIASMTLGINNEMKDPATYYSVFFPTMLRCEHTHFWGYFQNPNGEVLAIASPDAVASWHIGYMGNGHRIATTHIDLLNKLPLPTRHPQNQFYLAPNETKTYSFALIPANSIQEVPSLVANVCGAPIISLERTTVSSGEIIDLTVSQKGTEEPLLVIKDSEGKEVTVRTKTHQSNKWEYEIEAPQQDGTCSFTVSANGFRTEASVYVRKPWGWYLNKARTESQRMQQKAMYHREGWLGFFSEYWAHVYYPDVQKLAETERDFEIFLGEMVDPSTGFFYTDGRSWHARPQNTSWMLGLFIARYAATTNKAHLKQASDWADFMIDKFQQPNGAYEGYTALTLGSKFIQELLWFEKPLAKKSKVWRVRYERHYKSALAASKNSLIERDLGKTEGESTYEDSQAGSTWSLFAMRALFETDESLYNSYLKGSVDIQKRHECLTQALIPDSRMRGGSLRFWESQYDVLIHKNMMNSPHAWTMRSQFGALYLYLLTGEEYYLNVGVNAMGSCVQAIDHHTGILRWAFVPDPYVETERFVPDPRNPGKGKHVPTVIGEEWLPMISDWFVVPEKKVGKMWDQGWSCDNDVHEHFRVLTEQFIPNAFVLEREDGSLRTWNCTIKKDGNKLVVQPSEPVVSRVHFNMKKDYNVEIRFETKKTCKAKVGNKMQWIGPGLKDHKAPDVYLWKEMK